MQKRRMDIENASWELLHEPGREQAHVPGEADQVNFVFFERGNNFAIVLFTFFALRRNHQRCETKPAGNFEPCGIRSVRDHHRDMSSWNFSRCSVLRDSLEV